MDPPAASVKACIAHTGSGAAGLGMRFPPLHVLIIVIQNQICLLRSAEIRTMWLGSSDSLLARMM
jgi:hypothetical protein